METGGGEITETKEFEITVKSNKGGTITPSDVTVEKGANQRFKIEAYEGYEIEDVIIDDKSVGAIDTYTFKNVIKNHTIEAKFKKIETKEEEKNVVAYSDVSKTSWYSDAIDFVTEKNLMNGTGDGKFSPELSITRGMLVTVLYRLSGALETEQSDFTDVANDSYYSNAIAWATKNGIVNGIGDNLFKPDRAITREEMATIFDRYINKNQIEIEKESSMKNYIDGNNFSEYALSAIENMTKIGLMQGKGEDRFDPKGTATRAETATILMRFIQKQEIN